MVPARSRVFVETYVRKETAVSLVISVSLTALIFFAKILADGTQSFTPAEVQQGLIPGMVMSAFMSALLPEVIADWRDRQKRAERDTRRHVRAAIRHVGTAASLALLSLLPGTLLMRSMIHIVGPGPVGPWTILALSLAYAAIAALVVTPIALLLLLGRTDRAVRLEGQLGGERE